MRRPALTAKQRKHARTERALLALRRAAVRYSITEDFDEMRAAELDAAADKYSESLPAAERRRLARVARYA